MTLSAFPLLGPDRGTMTQEAVGVLCDTGGGRVLLQLRDDLPGVDQRGRWCLFGGGREPGEALADTAAREFAEETGVIVPPGDFAPLCRVHARDKPLTIFVFTLAAAIAPGDIRVGEGVGFGMFTARQLRGLDFIPHLRPVLEQHFSAKVFATE